MFNFSKVTLALMASGVLAISAQTYAQEAENSTAETNEDDIEVIEVTGFKSSLIKSINQKRWADTVSEQISADDLGGLPDVSMADALTRLPGIAAVRTGGQAAEINIRGLGGGFVSSTLNGREQVSTSGSRSIEYDQYPSELISSAAVYKSSKASLIEGGVAGTVELKTASPLTNEEQHTFNVNLRGMYNDRASEVADAEEFGHRFSFSYQGKFLEETLGLSLGYARLYQPGVATQFIGFAYNADKDLDFLANDMDGPADAPENEFISEGFELQHLGGEETRNGYIGAIEWAPNDTFIVRADAFISQFDSESFARGFRVKFDGETAAISNPVIVNNSMIGGTINRKSKGNNTRVELVNDDNQDFDEVQSYGLNLDWQITDQLNASMDISYSSAESEFRNGLLWSLVAEDANAENPVLDQNVSISYMLNGLDLPDVGFSQEDAFTDIDRVMVSKYGIYPYENTDELKAYRLDFNYSLDNDFISSVEFGVRYSDRDYSSDRSVYEYGADNNFSSSEPPLRLTEDMVEVVDWEGEFGYFPSYLAIDLDKALNAWFGDDIPQPVQTWGADEDGVINNSTSWSVLQSGEVYEKVFSAYVMANLDFELFDTPISGNIGIRMVDTDQSATALDNVGGVLAAGAQNVMDEVGLVNSNYAPKVIGIEYTDYLPSLNLNARLTDDSQLRFAAAKVMSRPPINRLAADRSATVADDGKVSGSSNNSPFLKPFYATQYDLSYEYYFSETDGAVAVALFYKDIESFIQNLTVSNFDFKEAGFYVPDTIENETTGVVSEVDPVGIYSTAINNEEGGNIKGLEISYTQVFSFLPELWSGLGLSLSYSHTKSDVELVTDLAGGSVEQSLPGLSENLFTSTLFWEYQDFETRVSVRYRDEFVSEQWGVNQQIANFDEEVIIDYQASYNITENFGALFQVNNLTDEPTQSYFGSKQFSGTTQYFGRQFYLGVTYSF
ncbi:TonB-dependent receptor [Thalassotalea mangrovi]|uniref:TonB-dependent receptor n=1 Tax=Thalassotalea mangrovi TaxID=2572245 RepID=A0A4U1B8P9_9GAMM|nr:TonB-dependent receptor [Thalassotalea mangrovi]TKB46385.1 TonB-dependent receptor [Thalassotalea mangrovi]